MEILPDTIHRIAIQDGELYLSPAYDVAHRWAQLGFNILRYWDSDNKNLCNIAMDDGGAEFLIDSCGLHTISRTDMYEHEHAIYIDWSASTMDDSWLD